MIENFHFLRPQWLFALIPLLLLLWFAMRRSNTSQSWKAICDAELLPHVLTRSGGVQSQLARWLILTAGVLSILAAAGPAWHKLPQPVFRDQAALVIALDLSQSMNATDIKPSRLSRARLKLLDILDTRQLGQTALIVYAQDAFVVAPLTDDNETIANLVPTLSTDLMPAQGSNTMAAISKASRLLQQSGLAEGNILLITDGVDADVTEQVARSHNPAYRLSILGIGTTDGSPIPMQGGFLQDDSGSIVIARTDHALLEQAAAAGGGLYRAMSNDDADIDSLLELFDSASVDMQDKQLDITADVWREEGPWLLLLVIPLAATFARRGWLMSVGVAVIVSISTPDEALALELDQLWQTKDQQAMEAFEQGDNAAAAEQFEDRHWKASALYKSGRYQQAIDAIDQPVSSDDHYNRANAQARSGALQEAIASYDEALRIDPDNEDAAYNKQLVEDQLKQMQQQQQQSSQQDGDKQDGEQQDGDQQQAQQQDGQKQNGQQPQSAQDGGDQQAQPNQGSQSDTDDQNDDHNDEQTENQSEQQDSDSQQAQPDQQQQASETDIAQHEDEAAEKAREQQDAEITARNSSEISEREKDQQARVTEQWLQRIPDDPGGLLRRKFLYQYKQRDGQRQSSQPW